MKMVLTKTEAEQALRVHLGLDRFCEIEIVPDPTPVPPPPKPAVDFDDLPF
jgi:hypothetical protein